MSSLFAINLSIVWLHNYIETDIWWILLSIFHAVDQFSVHLIIVWMDGQLCLHLFNVLTFSQFKTARAKSRNVDLSWACLSMNLQWPDRLESEVFIHSIECEYNCCDGMVSSQICPGMCIYWIIRPWLTLLTCFTMLMLLWVLQQIVWNCLPTDPAAWASHWTISDLFYHPTISPLLTICSIVS